MGTVISMALMQTECLMALEAAMLVEKAVQNHMAPEALEEITQKSDL